MTSRFRLLLGSNLPVLLRKVGSHDGAYNGRTHVIVPFIGRKNGTLTTRQQCYNDVHGWYRAHFEQLFARLWHWGLVGNIWRGGPNELHQSFRILLHFTQFYIRRQVRQPPARTMGACPASRFGLPKATRPPHKMRQRMRRKCVCCVANGTPPSQFVMSVRSTIVMNVLTPILVGPMLFAKYTTNDSGSG